MEALVGLKKQYGESPFERYEIVGIVGGSTITRYERGKSLSDCGWNLGEFFRQEFKVIYIPAKRYLIAGNPVIASDDLKAHGLDVVPGPHYIDVAA